MFEIDRAERFGVQSFSRRKNTRAGRVVPVGPGSTFGAARNRAKPTLPTVDPVPDPSSATRRSLNRPRRRRSSDRIRMPPMRVRPDRRKRTVRSGTVMAGARRRFERSFMPHESSRRIRRRSSGGRGAGCWQGTNRVVAGWAGWHRYWWNVPSGTVSVFERAVGRARRTIKSPRAVHERHCCGRFHPFPSRNTPGHRRAGHGRPVSPARERPADGEVGRRRRRRRRRRRGVLKHLSPLVPRRHRFMRFRWRP